MSLRTRPGLGALICTVMLLGALAGCAGFGRRLEPPRVRVAEIRVLEVKALEAVFQVDLRVINANETALEVKAVDCDLEVNGRRFASGVADTPAQIPAFGTALVPVVVYSNVLDLVRGVIRLQGREGLQYKLSGKVHLGGGGLLPPVIPFTSEGELTPEEE